LAWLKTFQNPCFRPKSLLLFSPHMWHDPLQLSSVQGICTRLRNFYR
jgi:hypothetical protein